MPEENKMFVARKNDPPLARPERQLSIARLALLIAVVMALTVLVRNRQVAANPGTEGNSNIYAEEIAKTYDFKFGPNPFSPSNASTTTGTFIPGEMFVPAKRCGTCHTDAHAQWRQSAHGNAFREPFYQKNVKDLQTQKGIEFTRHCESCHNPAALFTGALTKNSKVRRPFDDDGVSWLIYRKLGRTEEAKREAKIFADLKDDPGALSLANQFLRKHPEMSNESVYWHVHELGRKAGDSVQGATGARE